MTALKFDVVIIGSGPGGVHAAVQAAKLGKRVAVVERCKDQLGGACIHTGTIPSKTLREILATVQSVTEHVGKEWMQRMVNGMTAEKLYTRAKAVSLQEESVVREYIKRNRIQVFTGFGRLKSANIVSVENSTPLGLAITDLETEKVIVATGSKPRRPIDVPFDGWRIVDSDQVLGLESVPESMVIYGAGVIGCEYACIFNALGVQVTLVDARTTVMQELDRETTEELRSIMEANGIRFFLGHTLKEARGDGPVAVSTYESGSCIQSNVFFFSAGRVSATSDMGLVELGVSINDRGAIKVNPHFQTAVPNIYAVGDAIGAPALAATSAQQGRHASKHAFGAKLKDFPAQYPIGIYTIPEMSSVGKTEEQLQRENIPYVVGHARFSEIARGYIRGDHRGLLKILMCPEKHRILGLHIVGPDACNLIHIGLGFMIYGCPVQDIVDKMIFNYPTLAETYRVAAFNALNKVFPDGIFGDPPKPGEIEESEKAAA